MMTATIGLANNEFLTIFVKKRLKNIPCAVAQKAKLPTILSRSSTIKIMNLENQVTSFEISKRLKDLEVKQESLWYWQKSDVFQRWIVCPYADDGFKGSQSISAFTVAELGEMLPKTTRYSMEQNLVDGFEPEKYRTWYWVVDCNDPKTNRHVETADTEADARGKMLIYLLENKLI